MIIPRLFTVRIPHRNWRMPFKMPHILKLIIVLRMWPIPPLMPKIRLNMRFNYHSDQPTVIVGMNSLIPMNFIHALTQRYTRRFSGFLTWERRRAVHSSWEASISEAGVIWEPLMPSSPHKHHCRCLVIDSKRFYILCLFLE